jgi:hypothetical protein
MFASAADVSAEGGFAEVVRLCAANMPILPGVILVTGTWSPPIPAIPSCCMGMWVLPGMKPEL